MSSTNRNGSWCQHVFIAIIIYLVRYSIGNPVTFHTSSFLNFQSHRNMRNLPCVVLRSGLEGVCMFAIHCLKANGTHLGTCRDGYYFKSCCQIHPDAPSILEQEITDNSIDQNTISHFQHQPPSSIVTNDVPYIPINLITIDDLRNPTTLPTRTSSQSYHSTVLSDIITSISDVTIQPSSHRTEYVSSRISSSPIPYITTTSVTTTTSEPMKLQTFQTVQDVTTNKPSTSPSTPSTTVTIRESTTTPKHTKRPKPSTTSSATPTHKLTQSTRKPPIHTTTTIKHRPSTTTTIPPIESKKSTTRRPVTATSTSSHRPTTSTPSEEITKSTTKRPTTSSFMASKTKPTRRVTTQKPTQPIVNETASIGYSTTTQKAADQNYQSISQFSSKVPSTTIAEPLVTISFVETTKAPRPKPKPTSDIVKVPPTNLDHLMEDNVESEFTTTQHVSSLTTTKEDLKMKNSSGTLSDTITTTTTTYIPPSATTTMSSLSSTQSASTTSRPMTTSSFIETTKGTINFPTSISLDESQTTTVKPYPTVGDETKSPDLVTWSNIIDNPSTEYSEKPNTQGNWIMLSTIEPDTSTSEAHLTTSQLENESKKPDPLDIHKDSGVFSTTLDFTTDTSTIETENQSNKPVETTIVTKLEESTSATTIIASDSKVTSPLPSSTVATSIGETSSMSSSTISPPIKFPDNETASKPIIDNSINETAIIVNTTQSTLTTTSTTLITTPAIPSLEGLDYRQVCGKRMYPEPRIVGGSKASFGRWPWQISLRQWRTSTYLHKCGAALLNENWAITAAHCVDNVPPSDLLLRLGEYDLAEEEEPYGYQERRVQIVASHPQFDPRTFEYDLALLRFYEPVEFQPNIIPVCVPATDENFIGRTAYVTGWGRLYEDGPLPSVLQEVSVPVINNTICETMYRNAGYIEHIPHIFICAGWRKGGYDSCEGDSGGPMVIQRDDKRFLLAGVISWGIGCAEPNQPGVYTRISEFRDWINQILQF